MTSYRIIAPHFCAGVVLDGGKVARAAPILKYMQGWRLKDVFNYCSRKHWTIERVG